LQQKNYREAEPALAKAVALDPNQPDAHYQLGRLYQATGRSAQAEKELQKVRELHEKQDSLVGKMPSSSSAPDSAQAK
jgi:Flp pilus assembly protein TadD